MSKRKNISKKAQIEAYNSQKFISFGTPNIQQSLEAFSQQQKIK